MKSTLISLCVAFLTAVLVYVTIFLFNPEMYVETAFNVLVAAFLGSAVCTALALGWKNRRR